MSIVRYSAAQEYAKDPDLPRESVALLLDWSLKQPHLPNITEEDVILFLSSCYYSIEQAKQVIDIYYTFRTHVPELFANRDPLDEASADNLQRACFIACPGLTDEGYKEAMPVRLKGIHFVNPPSVMDRILALMRPFLNKETSSNLHIHCDMNDLHLYVPKRILPRDAGGDLSTIDILHAENLKKLKANRDWITSEEKFRVDESLRPEKAKSASDLFGVEGSFKKLEID